MTEYIVIGVIVIALTIACIITAKTARQVSVLLARATKEVVEIVIDIRKANEELTELRKNLRERQNRKTSNRSIVERRQHDRRKEDRRTEESRREPKDNNDQQDSE